MNILLLSMPDSFEHMPTVAIRMPNGSLAGNVDQNHRVAVADLVLCQRTVRETVTRLVHEFDPELVGFSVMTFQRRTAERIMALVRSLKPNRIVSFVLDRPAFLVRPCKWTHDRAIGFQREHRIADRLRTR
jgi:hypothetical protein